MQYRTDKYGNELSILGFGCLRFPQKNGKIDYSATKEQILKAIGMGVNYFDTAYVYGGSEAVLGRILDEGGVRDQVKIATKLPHYLIKSRAGLERLFQEELKRLRTDHVEYYLMHMLTDVDTWKKLKGLGMEEWIAEKKATGQIGQVGFSYHGNTEAFCRLVDAYDWDFCQIQYNYLDEHAQAGRRGLRYAYERGIPVIIMEPLRGGKLVGRLPEKAKEIFGSFTPKRSPAEWGLRWLWNQPEVTVVLSGMNSLQMLRENVRVAEDSRPGELGEEEMGLYARVVQAIRENTKVGCTACGYCMPCPRGVDIPGTFAAYNRWYGEDKHNGWMDYVKCTALRHDSAAASKCVGCGKCEKHCPQGIGIRKELKNAAAALEDPIYRIFRKGIELFRAY